MTGVQTCALPIYKQKVKPEIAKLEDTVNEISEKMWIILQDNMATATSKIAAAQTIVRHQINLLEIKIKTGIFEDVDLSSMMIGKNIDEDTNRLIVNVFNNWGLIKNDKRTINANIGHIEQPSTKS